MDELILVSGLAGFFFFALIITGLVRKYSLKNALIDVPNERSSRHLATIESWGARCREIPGQIFLYCHYHSKHSCTYR